MHNNFGKNEYLRDFFQIIQLNIVTDIFLRAIINSMIHENICSTSRPDEIFRKALHKAIRDGNF